MLGLRSSRLLFNWHRLAKLLLQSSQLATDRSTKETVITHLDKGMRQDMLEETLKKALNRKGTFFELSCVGNAVLKGNLGTFHGTAVVECKQAAIADGNAMDIRSEIFERGLSIAHGLAMHDPLLRPDLGGDLLKEFGFLQCASESGAKQPGECPHRQEESLACRQPGLPIRMQPTSGSEIMYMRMKDQVAGPGMQDTHQPDLPTDMVRVKCKLLCSFG